MKKNTVIIFVNGILTDPESTSAWTDRAELWVLSNTPCRAAKYEYWSFALTRRMKQAKRVRELRTLVLEWFRKGYEIVLVGHSNGADIICRLLKSCPCRIKEAHLVAAACDHDFERNGINHAMRKGWLGRCVCYCSEDDNMLHLAKISWMLLHWVGLGYGYLGLVGPHNITYPGQCPVVWARDIWPNDETDHSEWWDAGRKFNQSMRLIVCGR